jgi:hypothetical protein
VVSKQQFNSTAKRFGQYQIKEAKELVGGPFAREACTTKSDVELTNIHRKQECLQLDTEERGRFIVLGIRQAGGAVGSGLW